jgi:hypothetical protein
VDKILHPVALLFRFRVEEEVTCMSYKEEDTLHPVALLFRFRVGV